MRPQLFTTYLAVLMVMLVLTSHGQMITRTDAIWARTTTAAITLDGVLSEPDWAVAESVHINFGQSAGIPGSGWYLENGPYPSDPTRATVKFLVKADSLYVGIIVRDSSVGGGLFNQFDGFLMNIRRKEQPNRPTNAFEYFYAWVTETWGCDTVAAQPGALPCFMGFAGGPRDTANRRIWDAATTVQGLSNDDAVPDVGYTSEIKFNAAERGYTVSQLGGDIVMFNISIYDADWRWPVQPGRASGNRVWLQCPWGNTNSFNHMRIFSDPSVTTTSGAVPAIDPDVRIGNAQNYTAPVIDGLLSEPIWQDAPSFQIKFGDAAIRNGYPSTGPFRSGQFQPDVNGGQAPVQEASLATVKWFFKEDTLYLGFDVSDQYVQYVSSPDRYDGFRVTINDRARLSATDSNLYAWNVRFYVNQSGAAGTDEDTPYLRDSVNAVRVALQLKGGTTVDTLGADTDLGYTAELAMRLTGFGYPAGRGDGVAFLGVTYYDGDSFGSLFTFSYGTRSWWFREGGSGDGPAWTYMDPAFIITDVPVSKQLPESYALLGNYPNPFNPATVIRYALPEPSTVTLEVYNVLGQLVSKQSFGRQQPGEQEATFNAGALSSGLYVYRVRMLVPGAHIERASFIGKMILLK